MMNVGRKRSQEWLSFAIRHSLFDIRNCFET